MKLEAHDVVLIVGKRGSGKSYRAKELIAEQLAAGVRVCFFDPHDEYSQKGQASDQVNLGPLKNRCTVDELLDSRGKLLNDPKLSLAIVPRMRPRKALAEDLADVATQVQLARNVVFGCDEVGEYSDIANDDLISLATQSRHYSVPVVFVAQRMVQVPLTARSQTSILFCGVQSNPADLDALRLLTGSPSFSADVSRLPRRRLLEWRDPH